MVENRFIDVKNVYEYTKYSVITVQSTGCYSMKDILKLNGKGIYDLFPRLKSKSYGLIKE